MSLEEVCHEGVVPVGVGVVGIAHTVDMVSALCAPFFVYEDVALRWFMGQALYLVVVLEPETSEETLGREDAEDFWRQADGEGASWLKEFVSTPYEFLKSEAGGVACPRTTFIWGFETTVEVRRVANYSPPQSPPKGGRNKFLKGRMMERYTVVIG